MIGSNANLMVQAYAVSIYSFCKLEKCSDLFTRLIVSKPGYCYDKLQLMEPYAY